MSETLVERVAREIVQATDGPWDFINQEGQEAAILQARSAISAVLEAMREPTPEMLLAGSQAFRSYALRWTEGSPAVWQAILDAFTRTALTEDGDGGN